MSLIGLKVWPPARHSNRLHLKLATEILSSRWVHCSDWTPDWGVQAEEWKFWSFLHELNCLLSEYSQARGLWSGYEAAQSYSESICWMLLPRLISAGAGDTHSLTPLTPLLVKVKTLRKWLRVLFAETEWSEEAHQSSSPRSTHFPHHSSLQLLTAAVCRITSF